MKRNLRFWKIVLSAFALTFALIFCGCGDEDGHSNEPVFVMSDMWGASCHTAKMTSYLNDSVDSILNYATGTSEVSKPAAYHFEWTVKNAKKFKIKDYTFVLATDQVLSEVLYTVTVTDNYVDLYNFYLEKYYFWCVYANMEDGTSYPSAVMDFVTDGTAPRVLNVDGVTNCRDLGGWKIEGTEMTYVRQGMIYRTGRMNDNKKDNVTISETGIATLVDLLGVKTEIDLRQDEIRTESALGDTVTYVNIPMSGNDVYKNTENVADGVRQVFEILADENNYPVQIHCSVGSDRTGYISFLINGLLGVSEEDLYRDYLFSNFGKIDGMRELTDITESYVPMLNEQEGSSLSQKIYNYLVKIGVTEAEIESIRKIMIQER